MQLCSCGQINRAGARFCARCGRFIRAASPGRPALLAGQTMRDGAYRITRPLSRGGMGAVYLAHDTQAFDRLCVIKELLDYFDATDPTEVRKAEKRFEEEARILAALSHPGIPRIYAYFSENGRHYIVMEYIEGETLEQGITYQNEKGDTIPARLLPIEDIVHHAIEVCKVLEYLAALPRPVIHHDVKPANLILDRSSGEVRLVDFGTAKARYSFPGSGGMGIRKSSVYGTEGYAPPEQYQGRSEPRSDVYALAATIYHLLTDDDPRDHPFQFPRLDTLPSELAAVLRSALHVEVRRRSTARQMRLALEAWVKATKAFTFRNGAVALTVDELVPLCDRHWTEARKHLHEGDFERWFRDLNRHDLVAKAEAACHGKNDRDAALEAFLHALDPRLPNPALVVDPPSLAFGLLTTKGPIRQNLTLTNQGRGYCRLSLTSSAPWLATEPGQARCPAGKTVAVRVMLDPSALPLGRLHRATLTCIPSRGKEIAVPVRAESPLLREILGRLWGGGWRTLGGARKGARRGWHLWTTTANRVLVVHWRHFEPVIALALLGGLAACFLWAWFVPGNVWYKYIFVFLVGAVLTVPTLYLLLALVCAVTGAALGAMLKGLRRTTWRR